MTSLNATEIKEINGGVAPGGCIVLPFPIGPICPLPMPLPIYPIPVLL
ncbi:hypothetical protein [Aureibacter tunicatorum]|uniref:Uncharacterized protein n=1 Tax=Aureibacter tunicatorum TaxID=866807 RepID=A0AAE4BVV6_9BACT|nr:hypothetical protein [Aureibacter tunicatorum]MDR6242083.1 hypothetical protein [Aureibacter tunicatorum]BDD07564.1 hypothetical protein AUTU_50470 [Aureibacter tunicatorum]